MGVFRSSLSKAVIKIGWEDLEGAGGEGGGRGDRDGEHCKPMAVSFQCMTKFTTNKKINK